MIIKNNITLKSINFIFWSIVLWIFISFNVYQKEFSDYDYSKISWKSTQTKCTIEATHHYLSSFMNVNFKSYTVQETSENTIIKIFVHEDLPFVYNNSIKKISITVPKNHNPIFLGREGEERLICDTEKSNQ